jgi:hypothetical protein
MSNINNRKNLILVDSETPWFDETNKEYQENNKKQNNNKKNDNYDKIVIFLLVISFVLILGKLRHSFIFSNI